MLLRHPDEFGRAFAFDAPLNWTGTELFSDILGSDSSDNNYRLTNLLPQRAELLRGQPARLFMLGDSHGYARDQHAQIHNLMNSLGIPQVDDPGHFRAHRWENDWVQIGVELLLS